jgi:hypothetical protein
MDCPSEGAGTSHYLLSDKTYGARILSECLCRCAALFAAIDIAGRVVLF